MNFQQIKTKKLLNLSFLMFLKRLQIYQKKTIFRSNRFLINFVKLKKYKYYRFLYIQSLLKKFRHKLLFITCRKNFFLHYTDLRNGKFYTYSPKLFPDYHTARLRRAPLTGQQLFLILIHDLKDLGITGLTLINKGFIAPRYGFLKQIENTSFFISSYLEQTTLAFNGTRPSRAKRL